MAVASGRWSIPSISPVGTANATRCSGIRRGSRLGCRRGTDRNLGHREHLEDLLPVVDRRARRDELEDLLATPHLADEDRADELVLQEEEPLVVARLVLDLEERLRLWLLLGGHAHHRDVRV